LLAEAYRHTGLVPTCLERDFNIPALTELLQELARIREIQLGNAGLSKLGVAA
jgi:hypothetical protein